MNKVVVYDSDHPGAFNNRCFEEDYGNEGPGHNFTVALAKEVSRRGFEIITGDLFLKKKYTGETTALCITDMKSQRTELILRKGTIPFLCLSTESPLIAKDFYINIRRLAGRFLYNMQFKGTAERLSQTSTRFSPMFFPVDSRTTLPYRNWNERKYAVIINGNKRIFFSDTTTIKGAIRSVLSKSKLLLQKAIDPWIRSKEIYKDRIEAIFFFSKYSDFHLYGKGWENKIPGFPNEYHVAAKKCFKGSLPFDAKLKKLNEFKFVICFENCSFPGYVTEKIFDCFLAGSIPIYYGAPDITAFVPSNSFIDFRKFNSFKTLDDYLQNLSEAEAFGMLEAAKDFLSSEAFDKYYLPNVVRRMVDKIEQYPVLSQN
jgi:hypothetical protein